MIVSNTTGKEKHVVIVWDKEGKFFQVWPSDYNGDGLEHGIRIADQIGGTYLCVKPINVEERINEARRFEVQQNGLGHFPGFANLFETFFKWNQNNGRVK